MKIILIAALLGFSHLGFSQSKNDKHILLTGKIEGMGNSKLYVGVINGIYFPSIVDSFSCVNDSFNYMSKIPEGINLCCLQNQEGRQISFISDTNKIVFNGKKILFNGMGLYSVSILGSESNRKYSAYEEEGLRISLAMAPILTSAMKAQQDKDTMLFKRYSKQMDSLSVIQRNFPVNFIKENYHNYASAAVLYGYSYSPKGMNAKDLYSLLDNNVQHCNIGKNIKANLIAFENSSVGHKFIDCELIGLDGKKFKISSLKGKCFLIEFWSSWCVGCRQELPFLKEAFEKYKHSGFNILAISLDCSKQKWISTVEQLSMPGLNAYHLNEDSNNPLTPFVSEVAKSYFIKSVPSNFLVNPDGVIIATDLRGEDLIKKLNEIYKQ